MAINQQLYRQPNSTQVVDSTGTPQMFGGALDTLPIYNNNVIKADSLAPQAPINLPDIPTPATTPAQPINYDELFGLTALERQAQQQQETGIAEIVKSMTALQGEAQDLQAERQKRDVEGLFKKAQTIRSQITALDAEMQKDDIELVSKLRAEERRDTLLPFAQMGQARIQGDAAIYRALKNAEKNTLIAQQLATQGDLVLAEQFAKEAVDAKYAPYRQNIENMKTIFEFIKPSLTSAENKKLKEQEFKANMALREIEKSEAKEKEIQKMIIDATPNAPAQVISSANQIARQGGSALDVAMALGQYGGDYLGDKLKKIQIAKVGEEINKIREDIRASKEKATPATVAGIPNTANGFVSKLLLSGNNTKTLDATERQQLSKMSQVIAQLDSLQSNLNKNNKTGPFKGRVNKLLNNLGQNADISEINAQIQALIPNVARGIYGEVGVLTDADIENYRKTVASLTNTKDQNDAVLALTLKNALRSYESVLNTAVNSDIKVDGWAEDYFKIKKQVDGIEDRIGISKKSIHQLILQDNRLAPAVKEMKAQGLSDGDILDALNAR